MAAILRPIGQFPGPEPDVVTSFDRGKSALADIARGLDPGEAEDVDTVERFVAHQPLGCVIRLRDVFPRRKVEDADRNALGFQGKSHLPDIFADSQFTAGEADQVHPEGAVRDAWCSGSSVDSIHHADRFGVGRAFAGQLDDRLKQDLLRQKKV